jgi:(R)-2-hydroxyacyl-CoA dehydratese activating ATPase
MPVAGIDIGAGTAKVVILENDKMAASSVMPVRGNIDRAIEEVMANALDKAGLALRDLEFVVSTGYGRDAVPFAGASTTEIICHASGIHFLIPDARTIIDIGAQDSKVIRINEKGKVIDFAMNDKCAAGTGRFLEVMAHVLGVALDEMGPLSLTSKNLCNISSTCTVFAETEVVSLRAQGKAVEDLIAGIHWAIASRIVIMGSGIKLEQETVFTGGVAKNIGVQKALEKTGKLKCIVPVDPQITGALGAALIAQNELRGRSSNRVK